MTLQSAATHLYMFQHLFAIVEKDCGIPVHFRHIHRDGFETVVADAHKGQALGKLSSAQHLIPPLSPYRTGPALCLTMPGRWRHDMSLLLQMPSRVHDPL
jgi:hypothetical protein